MSRNFKAISITHQNAPLEIREKVALNENESMFLMNTLEEYTDMQDLLILSTCNRTELYFSSENSGLKDAVKFLALQKNINDIESIHPYIDFIEDKDDAIRHLFRHFFKLERGHDLFEIECLVQQYSTSIHKFYVP